MLRIFRRWDLYYERLGVEGLSIVKVALPSLSDNGIRCSSLIQRVTSRRIRMEKRRRLEGVWEKAGESIGCDGVPGVEHEARVMVEGLRQIRETIKETEDKILELCKQFPEYQYVLTISRVWPWMRRPRFWEP